MEQLAGRIRKHIEANKLPSNDNRLLVAVSGGADSVALLRLMLMLEYKCHAVHCNFRLRGEESNRDEAFVRRLCEELNVTYDVVTFDTKDYARKQKLSIEMAARQLRYEAFENLRKKRKCDYIAVAHHMEDSVETILLNLARGTGLDGLTGIAPLTGRIFRPLLNVKRREIEEFLQAIGQPYATDSTNASDDYARNKVRHRILPALEEINPAAVDNISRTARHLQGVKDVLGSQPSDEAGVTILHGLLNAHGYNETQIRNLLTALKTNRQTLIPSGNGSGAETGISVRRAAFDKHTLPRAKNTFCIDVRQIAFPIVLRTWQEGDRICPFGMNGKRKLVSDLLTEARLSRQERAQQQVLCIGGEIAWVVNIRSDERFRVPDSASEILVFESLKKEI